MEMFTRLHTKLLNILEVDEVLILKFIFVLLVVLFFEVSLFEIIDLNHFFMCALYMERKVRGHPSFHPFQNHNPTANPYPRNPPTSWRPYVSCPRNPKFVGPSPSIPNQWCHFHQTHTHYVTYCCVLKHKMHQKKKHCI